jgi:hypothetical protein
VVWLVVIVYSRELKGVRVVEGADCSDRPGEVERGLVDGGPRLESSFFLRGSHFNCMTVS